MREEIKAEWVAALRSGEYKQGQGVLRSRNDEFCCLGVLCDLAVKDGLAVDVRKDDECWWYYDDQTGVLPFSVAEWAGLNDPDQDYENPMVPAGEAGDLVGLAGLNDGHFHLEGDREPWTFQQIADVIEEHL